MSISDLLATLSGGDLPADAVREDRCLKPPIGCGTPLGDWSAEALLYEDALLYKDEWRITGLCPACQDTTEGDEEDLATDMWPVIRGFVAWLDDANGRGDEELALRIMKISEEVGEVTQAYIGMTGQNPRKGVTHTVEDVADELCDVAITALTALASVVDNPEVVFAAHLNRVQQRIARNAQSTPVHDAVDPNTCAKTPEAIRAALQRRPDWLQYFEQDWLSAAAKFDRAELDRVVDKWFPFACACATPGYLDQVEQMAKRLAEGDTEGMVFRDADGNAYDADNRPIAEPSQGSV